MTNNRYSTRAWTTMAMAGIVISATVASADKAEEAAPPNPPGSTAVVFAPEAPFREPPRMDLDAYGGWLGLSGKTTGFFHVEQLRNRWWLITPAGHAFYSLGMTGVPESAYAKYKTWGFNTVARPASLPDPDRRMPYTIGMYFFDQGKDLPIPRNAGIPPWVSFPDVFDPAWVEKCHEYAQKTLAPFAKDPWLVGYFIDNEPNFAGWYEVVTRMPKDAPFRNAFVEVARKYYADKPGQLVKDWKTWNVTKVEDLLGVEGDAPPLPELAAVWQEAVAEQAFGTVEAAARKAAPNHLNLGTRMINAVPPSPAVFAAMGRHVDVISMNLYSLFSDRLLTQMFTLLPAIHTFTKKPIMTSEFTFRGGDTRCPNTIGAPPTVPTQADRAVGYLSYLSAVASLPFHVGVCWYKYEDDSLELPWGGYAEDCNFGVVDGQRRPYASLVSTMRLVNGSIYELASDPVPNPKCPLFYRTELMRWDRAWDQRMFMRFGQMETPPPDPLGDQLPESRRYHEHYWVSHKSLQLVINDEGYYGWSSANLLRRLEDGQELALLGLQGFCSVPRTSWLGQKCENPAKPFSIDSNAQTLIRRVDGRGRVRRMTMIGGSFVLTEFSNFVIRANGKVPYLDLVYDPDAKKLAITSQGEIQNVGISDVTGWQTTWNGRAVTAGTLPNSAGISAFAAPPR
ncbi:MAG: hypothetical protein NTW96_08185 [Planctomycetia bacterium]|nr:hypothetical protein [Planctomycetia bacterium]